MSELADDFIKALDLFKQIEQKGYVRNGKVHIQQHFVPMPPPKVLPHPDSYEGRKDEYYDLLNKHCLGLYSDNDTMRFHLNLQVKVVIDNGECNEEFYIERHKFANCRIKVSDDYDKKADEIYDILYRLKEKGYIIVNFIPHKTTSEEYVVDDNVVKSEFKSQYDEWRLIIRTHYEKYKEWVNACLSVNPNTDLVEMEFEELCDNLINLTLDNYHKQACGGYGKTVNYYQIWELNDDEKNLLKVFKKPEKEWFETKMGKADITPRFYDVYVKCNTEFYKELVNRRVIDYRDFDLDMIDRVKRTFTDYEWQ